MIKSYNDIKVETIWSSPDPGANIREALDNTMKNISLVDPTHQGYLSPKMIKFLFQAEHSSVVEHAVISFRILGASRSWLAQITRHRMSSFTSSSQHYQDYTDYDNIIHPGLVHNFTFCANLEHLNQVYEKAIKEGISKEEARQILPNAKAVNLIWTINARSLYNFIRLRMCLRNVTEIRIFCDKVFLLVKQWWPEYADVLGPPCYVDGKCNQGIMTCGITYDCEDRL